MAKKAEAVAVAETPEALELKKLRDFIHRADEESGNDRLEAALAVDVAIAWIGELQREAGEARATAEELEQVRVQLAGCLVAAEGGTDPANVAKQGDYGWSLPYQTTLGLRQELDEVKAKYDHLFEQWTDLHRQLNEQISAAPAEVAELVSEQNEPFVRESAAGTVYKIRVAYDEFVSLVEGDFSPWDDLPDETKQMYADSVHHVREGGELRTDFERVVARLLIEASPASFE